MHREGHYGMALLVYAPVGFVTLLAGFPDLAILGGVVAVGGAMVPDLDQRIPGIDHRGITHTVWFALAAGVAIGAVGVIIGLARGVTAAIGMGLFGAVVGTLTIGAHLLADVLTPAGIRPFAPVDDTTYTLEVARAANPGANYALLVLGASVAGGAAAVGFLIV